MRKDKYKCIDDLKTCEFPKHYRIKPSFDSERTNRILIFSPHGGGIEKGVSEIVRELSKVGDYNSYLFEGKKKEGNKDLHITSHHFNEKMLFKLLEIHETALSIHGMKIKDKSIDIIIGGLNKTLGELIKKNLNGFSTCINENELPSQLNLFARRKDNVTNLCQIKQGVQLEISEELRRKFFERLSPQKFRNNKTKLYYNFINSLNKGIMEYLSS
jgi:phage replication-related protein YjqB (UPF0714/DUF867 family)